MNQKHLVWLPPDGDSRLLRFQQEVASRAGFPNGCPLPVHLALAPGVTAPSGPVTLGSWVLRNQEPVLLALVQGQSIGWFRFGLVRDHGWRDDEVSSLPTPEPWQWTRGVTAVLLLEQPHGDFAFTRWSWDQRRGWKAPSTE